jgi:hypothetical protein
MSGPRIWKPPDEIRRRAEIYRLSGEMLAVYNGDGLDDSNPGATAMHMRSLHKHQADWINWLGKRPLAFWIICLSPWLVIWWWKG